MSTIYICNRCGETMSNIYTRFTVDYLRGHMERDDHILDLCEKCNEEFEKFMKPTKDESSTVKLRPWSEVGPPPKINGYKLNNCAQCAYCEFDLTSIDEEPCASCGSGNSNFKSISENSENEDCEQCKFKDFSYDEEPCSNCDFSILANGVKRNNFEPKKEEADADDLSKAKYKIGSYIQSDITKDRIYKIMDIHLRDDGEFLYTVEDLSSGLPNVLWERVIDNYYTVIIKYSCDGCKLEGTDDCMCDTCIVGDPKGPRRQWWRPKEEE